MESPKNSLLLKISLKKNTPPPVKTNEISKTPVISLLLPFGLNHLKASSPYTSLSLREADISLGFYRGFKMALDSLTALGYSFKLQVFDTRGDKAQAHSLAYNQSVKASDLVVGPIYPVDVKAFSDAFTGRGPVLSPLSPAPPTTIKNKQLITAETPLEYHAWGAANYIVNNLEPKQLFILRSGFSEENDYIFPFKKAIDSLSNKGIKVATITVVHGDLSSITPQLSSTDQNLFIIPAQNQHFLAVTLRALDTLSRTYPVTVFGHPNWVNAGFLSADMLQRLDTHVTSAEQVNYKNGNTIAFVKNYRRLYNMEPTTYAIKGFDEGMLFGQLLATGNFSNLTSRDYPALHNDFLFQKKPGLGWINTHINIYKYSNFELKRVE